jgi:hypothetical protein
MDAMPDDVFERLTILERAEYLHASTLRRHSEHLDRHDAQMDMLRNLMEQQIQLQRDLQGIAVQHEERMAALQQTLDAIKDMLRGRNGHGPTP